MMSKKVRINVHTARKTPLQLKNIFYKDEKFDGKRVNEGEKDAFSYKV